MDSLYGQIETYIETNQIKSICGIDFGISREKALSILHKKYGVPSSDSNDMTLSFDNIKYAGLDFNNVHFLFQSDGIRSYFNCCIFVKNAKDKSEVIKTTELYYSVLSRKYNLLEIIDHNGFNTYSGGVSPLWDGKWYTFLENLDTGKYLSALHIDVIEYDNRLANVFGYKYGVRIIYGPYEFVEEEF